MKKSKYSREFLEVCGWTNKMLEVIKCDWRLGMITKAWPEDMKEGSDGGIGMVVWAFKDPVMIDGDDPGEPIWIIHPMSHAEYKEACGNPKGRWPMVLDQAFQIIGE